VADRMAKRKLLILGVTGFIGRNIAEHFASDDTYDIIGVHFQSKPFDDPTINFVRADLRDPKILDPLFANADIVIQAAATTSGAKEIVETPHIHVTDNAVMNSYLLRAAFEHKIEHYIWFSCTLMYPSREQPWREDEYDANIEFHDSYFGAGWTKLYTEKMCEFYASISETKFTVMRHSNVFGPHDKYDLKRSHMFGANVTKVMTNQDGKLVLWGNGKEKRDLLYVSDLVNFVTASITAQKTKFGLYNVGSGSAYAVQHIVQKIIDISGKKITIEHDLTKPSIQTALSVDCSKAAAELNWQPETSLEDGIRKTIDWYAENLG
jgi:GDP-L-fucose synthase